MGLVRVPAAFAADRGFRRARGGNPRPAPPPPSPPPAGRASAAAPSTWTAGAPGERARGSVHGPLGRVAGAPWSALERPGRGARAAGGRPAELQERSPAEPPRRPLRRPQRRSSRRCPPRGDPLARAPNPRRGAGVASAPSSALRPPPRALPPWEGPSRRGGRSGVSLGTPFDDVWSPPSKLPRRYFFPRR